MGPNLLGCVRAELTTIAFIPQAVKNDPQPRHGGHFAVDVCAAGLHGRALRLAGR